MKSTRVISSWLILLVLIGYAAAASAEDATPDGQSKPAEQATEDPSEFRFKLNLVFWLPTTLEGTAELGGVESSIDVSLRTLVDDLSWVAEGGFEAGYGDWSLLFWGFSGVLETDSKTQGPIVGELDTTGKLRAAHADVAVAYQLGEWPLAINDSSRWSLEALGGMRYWDLDVSVSLRDDGRSVGSDVEENWVDAIIGVRTKLQLTEKIRASLRADMGGFNIGTSAKNDWGLLVTTEYQLSDRTYFILGYKYIDLDWSKGSGSSRAAYDLKLYGPTVGVSIEF
jgi:hypothetical protein